MLGKNYQVPEQFRNDLVFLLRVAAEKAGEVLDDELRALNIHSRAAHILFAAEEMPMNQSTLAEKTKTHPNAITSLLNGLEDKKLIVRELNPANRREYRVKITSSGEKFLDEIREGDKRGQERVAETLTAAEKKELTRLLLKLIEAWF